MERLKADRNNSKEEPKAGAQELEKKVEALGWLEMETFC